jgi:phosphoribosyl 1,2-cyclic phosphodiesterase
VQARIWGCRGSLATPGGETLRYGGNTTCVEVRAESGAVVVLDAGTGVRDLGRSLAGEKVRELDLLLTHLHLDHIEGLGFLASLFDPECTVRIYGPRPDGGSLEEKLTSYLSPPYFPLPFEHFDADISFHELERDTFELDGLTVSSVPVRHPGPTLAYRLVEDTRSFAFVPDNEPGLDRESGLEVAGGADVLLHDSQYTDEEYAQRVGWGHASLSHLVRYLGDTAPKRAVMVHHDPDHDAAVLEKLLAEARERSGRGEDALELGYEGFLVDLSPS